MLPKNQNDGNAQQPSGAAGQSTSQPASGAESQPLPDYVTALQGQIATLTEQLEGLGTQVKGVQKGTDKQIGQVRGDIKRILELREKGLDESQINRELFLDSLIQGQSTPQAGGTTDTRPAAPSLDVEPMLKSLQFPENDPSLAALRIKFNGNPQGLLAAAAELRLSQVQSPNPSGATGLSPQGGVATTSLQAEYEQRRTQLAQSQRGDQLTRSLAILKAEYRQKGLAQI